jgi:hypothetical protein
VRRGASAHDAVRAAARHACSATVMSPAHGTRCGEGNDGVSPARGRWRGRPRGIDSDAWTTRRRGKGDGTMAYQAESATAASGRGRRRRRRRGVDDSVGMRGLAATGTEAAEQRWWCARTAMFGHLRSVTRVARRSAAATWSGGGRRGRDEHARSRQLL